MGLLTNDAIALYFFGISQDVVNVPVATHEFGGGIAFIDDVDGIADDVDFSLASAPNVPLCSKTTSLLLFRVPVTLFGVDSVVSRLPPTAALEEER